MSKSNNDIEKIDEQIKNLMDEENDDNRTIIVDRKYEYDDLENNDVEKTKRIDVIENLDRDDSIDDTKKIDTISDIEEKKDINNNEENDDDFLDNKQDDSEEKIDDDFKDLCDDNKNKENEIDEDFSDVKKGNGIIWIVLSFVFVMIFLVSFILFMFFGNEKKEDKTKKDDNNTVTITKNDQKDILNKYGDALKGVIVMNIDKNNKLLSYNDAVKLVDFDYKVECSEHYIYDDGSIYLNKCKINDMKISYSYGEKQEKKKEEVIEDDDSIKVYVSKKNSEVSFKEPNNLDDYDVYSFNIEGKYSNLTFLSDTGDYIFYYDEDNNVQMINFKKDRKALSPLNYTSILPIKYDGIYDDSVVAVKINGKWGFYNLNTRERIVAHKYENVVVNLGVGINGTPLFIDAVEQGKVVVVEDGDYGVINYNNGSEVIPVRYSGINRSGNYLWVIDDEENGHIFDYSGKEYLSDSFDDIYGIVEGSYVLVNDNDELKLVKVNGKVYFNYGKVDYGKYNFGIKYKSGVLFQFYKANSSSNSCIEVVYDSSDKTGDVKDIECGAIDISK